jgi:regulator of protease activity HflC (stomatin/prohibitin superfamily)
MSDGYGELRRREIEREGVSPLVKIIAGIMGAAIIIGFAMIFLTERVDATESCVITSFGKEVGTAGPGLHFTSPDKSFACYTIRQRTMELVAGDPAASNSKADFVDWAIKARTLDGIDLYSMLTMQYHIDPAAPTTLYPTYVSDEAVKEQLVKSRLRSVVPQILSLTDANVQYKGNLGPISDEIEIELKRQLDPFGIKVDYFELKRSDFDDRFEEAIRNRAGEVELAEKKRLEQETARQEAERLAIQTKGDNDAALAIAQKDNAVRKAQTDAEVYDLNKRAEALNENPDLLEWERVQAIRDAGAIYLPSETLPLFNVPPAKEEPTG